MSVTTTPHRATAASASLRLRTVGFASRREPARSRRAREEGGREAERRRREAAQPRVLVVDDEDAIRLLCRVNLRLGGMEVLEASDGAVGLELARRELPDLILLDVMMPTVDGWEVAEALARDPATSEIPIVFLSARSERVDQRRGIEAGAVGYVTKPFDPLRLAPFLQELLERVERGERDRLRAERLDELGPG